MSHKGFTELADVPKEHDLPFQDQTEYLVAGQLKQWTGSFADILSPVSVKNADGVSKRVVGRIPKMTPEAALEALEGAVKAYDHGRGEWPTSNVATRIKCLEKFTFAMVQKRKEIVNGLMWEIGKTLPDSEKEFDRTVEYIRDTINSLKDLDRNSSRFIIEQGIIGQVRRASLGVVLCMGPFNYPLNETFTTLIPALIMGNTIVFKPPKFGVLIFRPLLEAFRDCFPAGVVNTVYGEGGVVVGPIMSSGKVDVLAFIGTSRVADILKKQHPKPHRLRSVLGLDAKNPGIILPDADVDLAVKECILGTLSFNGQRCTALKILFVHKDIYDKFVDKFSAAVDALPLGLPWEKGTAITPLPEANKTETLKGLVDDAVAKGATLKVGGQATHTFFKPAVVAGVTKDMKLFTEEQFGPIVPIVKIDDISTFVDYIVESNYGQQVSIFSTNPDTIANLVDPLTNQVSRVNINSQCQRGPDVFPFTGRKDSAEGTLSVSDALRCFSIRSLVAAKAVDINKEIITTILKGHKSHFLSTDFIF